MQVNSDTCKERKLGVLLSRRVKEKWEKKDTQKGVFPHRLREREITSASLVLVLSFYLQHTVQVHDTETLTRTFSSFFLSFLHPLITLKIQILGFL